MVHIAKILCLSQGERGQLQKKSPAGIRPCSVRVQRRGLNIFFKFRGGVFLLVGKYMIEGKHLILF